METRDLDALARACVMELMHSHEPRETVVARWMQKALDGAPTLEVPVPASAPGVAHQSQSNDAIAAALLGVVMNMVIFAAVESSEWDDVSEAKSVLHEAARRLKAVGAG